MTSFLYKSNITFSNYINSGKLLKICNYLPVHISVFECKIQSSSNFPSLFSQIVSDLNLNKVLQQNSGSAINDLLYNLSSAEDF